jgi:FtsP/CotA-like multicopper oxidase with cupredoxin domain
VQANEGDTLVVDVHNQMTNSTSIHWHGFHQNGTNFMDGTVGVTNCAIPPGESFRYEFTAEHLRGTYWYHAHFSTMRIDGLFGPLVVHSPKEKIALEYDRDRVVMVQDYYHDLSHELLPTYLAPGNENAEPVPNTALINGKGIFDCSKVDERYKCDASTAALEVLDLEKDKAHRLRFINVGAFAEFDISLDENEVALVEVDGVEVVPHTINRFRINVAQRYSMIIPANPAGTSFWMRARMFEHCFAEIPATLQPEVKAIVSYSSSQDTPTPPTSKPWTDSPGLECRDMNLTQVSPLHSIAAPETADIIIPLRSNFEIGAYQLSRGFFNKTSWRPEQTPTLFQAIDGLKTENDSFITPRNTVLKEAYDTKRQLVVKLDKGMVVDLLIDNFDDGNHPFHLHGHKFWVLGQGTGYFDMKNYRSINTTNPLRRDTVTIEAFGWVLIRFVADNPGMWAMHCHLAWHAEAGMLMQFLVGTETVKSWDVPENVQDMCKHPEKQRGGPMKDEDFYW